MKKLVLTDAEFEELKETLNDTGICPGQILADCPTVSGTRRRCDSYENCTTCWRAELEKRCQDD